ncbi:MAG TPA: alpha/beta hydrolase [Streptosporangiaceae bacterium]|jgi:pimeloyl-ACP methyl ester carboxylesterase
MSAGSVGQFPARDGLKLVYRTIGQGRPLILLHGYTSSGQQFLDGGLPDALAQGGYRVVLPDLRAHGDSPRPHDPAAYPPEVLADDGLALADFLGLSQDGYDLGGYSLGGKVVLRMLVRGARPRRAVIGGQGLDAIDAASSRTGGYRTMLENLARGAPLEPRQAAWMAEARVDPVALLGVMDSFTDVTPAELARITVPTLVVAGEQDERQAAELAAALPDARHVPVPGDHATAPHQPAFAAAILEFLAP